MVEKLLEGVYRVDLGRVNAYLVDGEEGPIAVDAGMPGDGEAIASAMREVGMAPSELATVLVTHTDLDHVGGLASLVEGTPATIHLSPTAAKLLTGERQPPWLSTKGLFQRATSPWLDPPPAERLSTVLDGDTVHGLTAVHTPGHALGHVAYVDADAELCFVGDLVRTEGEHPHVPPRFINYDTGRIETSIRHLLEVAPSLECLCAGHGDPVRSGGAAELRRLVA